MPIFRIHYFAAVIYLIWMVCVKSGLVFVLFPIVSIWGMIIFVGLTRKKVSDQIRAQYPDLYNKYAIEQRKISFSSDARHVDVGLFTKEEIDSITDPELRKTIADLKLITRTILRTTGIVTAIAIIITIAWWPHL
ncbi:hypothetical protein QNI19_38565 [Cytophagaceae bacterium DM2B3-1]|uniref:ABC transmembrane type-1 domain-containing protein n=1 Tax=Xanthocytophaga flava TaxID=3048013 RepID=A0ABT7CYT2_9BACT|nr:hypothetical protein [Xanthocytophaga flavus]MDJ1498895.1 hypothetical protein [Xanthocytophaga flavus]